MTERNNVCMGVWGLLMGRGEWCGAILVGGGGRCVSTERVAAFGVCESHRVIYDQESRLR